MKRFKLLLTVLVLSGAANLQAIVDPVFPVSLDAELIEDAYVDSVQTDTTYNSTVLQARGYDNDPSPGAGVNSDQRCFIKFSVDEELIGKTVVSAKFGIYVRSFSAYTEPSMQLWHVGDGWSEESITWNNSTALMTAATKVGFEEMVDTIRYYEWDVLADWDVADQTDGKVSYMLTMSDEDINNFAYFNSSEYKEAIPYLHIAYIPEPATLALLGLGSLLTLGRNRK